MRPRVGGQSRRRRRRRRGAGCGGQRRVNDGPAYICVRVEVVYLTARTFLDQNVAPRGAERRRIDPRFQGHARRQVQRCRRIHGHQVARPIERQRPAKLPARHPRCAGDRARPIVPARIGDARPTRLVEIVGRHQPGRRRQRRRLERRREGLGGDRHDNRVILRTAVRPRDECIVDRPRRLVLRVDRVSEARQRVHYEGSRPRHAIDRAARPAGLVANVRLTFCGYTDTELVVCRPDESVTGQDDLVEGVAGEARGPRSGW